MIFDPIVTQPHSTMFFEFLHMLMCFVSLSLFTHHWHLIWEILSGFNFCGGTCIYSYPIFLCVAFIFWVYRFVGTIMNCGVGLEVLFHTRTIDISLSPLLFYFGSWILKKTLDQWTKSHCPSPFYSWAEQHMLSFPYLCSSSLLGLEPIGEPWTLVHDFGVPSSFIDSILTPFYFF